MTYQESSELFEASLQGDTEEVSKLLSRLDSETMEEVKDAAFRLYLACD